MCSVGFLILHCVGHRKIGKIPPTSVVAYFFILLFFYPVVPIVCCAYSFVTARKVHIAMLAKLFEGFLDDGPQYDHVLQLILAHMAKNIANLPSSKIANVSGTC